MDAPVPNNAGKSEKTSSGLNIVLGLWLLASPAVLEFREVEPAALNNILLGITICGFAVLRLTSGRNQPGWSWANALFGIWMVISPFALHFGSHSVPKWNNIIAGIAVLLLAWASAAEARCRRGTVPNGSKPQ